MILFSAKKAKMRKTFVAFCASCGINPWFMNGLRKRRRRKDAFFQLSAIRRVSCQGSGAVLPSDCFHCAPRGGNYLQGQWTVDREQPPHRRRAVPSPLRAKIASLTPTSKNHSLPPQEAEFASWGPRLLGTPSRRGP